MHHTTNKMFKTVGPKFQREGNKIHIMNIIKGVELGKKRNQISWMHIHVLSMFVVACERDLTFSKTELLSPSVQFV